MKEIKEFHKEKLRFDKIKIHRKKIEEALQESELKFRTLFDSAANAIFIVKNGKFIDCNPKALDIFGCGKEQIIGKTPHRYSPRKQPDGQKSREKYLEMIEAAIAGTQQLFEWLHLRFDGTPFWAEVSLNRFELNRKYYLLAVIRDITKRKEAEKALQESEERYRALFEGANEGILVADIETRKYILTNPAVFQLLGYSQEEMKQLSIWEIHPEDSQEEVISQFGALVRGDKAVASNIPCLRKNGTIFYADIKASWATVDSKECLVSFLTDVSERRHALEAVKESEDRLRTILNSLQVGVVIIDAKTKKITDTNPVVVTMIGAPAEKIVGSKCRQYICPTEEACPILDKGKKINNSECILRKANGEGVPILKTVTYIILGGQEFLLESFIDISEKKRLEAQLFQAQKMEAVGRLAGGIAHDFNNLLMVITGQAELMLMKMEEDSPLRKRIEEIQRAGERAASLTRQLLAFSRKQVLKTELLNLNKVVTGIEGMLKRLLGEDIKFISSFNPQIKSIRGDAGQIDQIILNLAINAREAMPEGGELIIETENVTVDRHFGKLFPEARAGEFACLSIADDGIGMDQDVVQQIFEPFFTTREGGTGLGLSVVYGIVKQHGGWIKVYSAPGIGSNFQIFFPVVSSGLRVEMDQETLSRNLGGKGERILVVEDEESVRKVTVEALKENGYRVTEVSSAEEAVQVFKREKGKFDLVLTDIVLPDKSGLQLVDKLTLLKPGLQVVLVSGYPGKKSQWEDISRKGYHFLQKPFTLVGLLLYIKEALNFSKNT